MSISAQSLQREHHFCASTAKFLFHHPERGIVAVRDPIRLEDAKRYGLSPLILYGLTVAGLPIRWLTFSAIDQRIPLSKVLRTAWASAEGLRGPPDVLRLNHNLAQADHRLAADLARMGIQFEIADAKDKPLPASLRSAQDAARWLLKWHKADAPSLVEALDALCRNAREDHEYSSRHGSRGLSNRDLEDRIERWLALPMRRPGSIATEAVDWDAGPWLSSWESSLPPDRTRYFNRDGLDGTTWLLSGREPSEDDIEDDPSLGEYAEERRLFYVALTRASRGVFLLANSREPSRYIRELSEIAGDNLRFESVDGDLLRQCPACRVGHLVERTGRNNGGFLGCNQYPGCDHTMPMK